MSDTTGKCMEIKVGQYLKNYRMVQHVELTDECIERIADAVVKKMSTSNPSVLHMKIKADAEAVKKAMDGHMANLREYAHDFGVTIEQAEEDLRIEEE